MTIETIDVYSLKDISYLSPIKCQDFSEAAAVCLDYHQHLQKCSIKVEGDLKGEFNLIWQNVTKQIKDSRNSKKMTAAKTIHPIDELHNKAMELADNGFYANRTGNSSEAQQYYQEAFQYEKAAAMLLVNDYKAEPTRSVLFRSAASLILNYPTLNEEDFREAERMVAFGLTGNPPFEIAEEMRLVLNQVKEKYSSVSAKTGKPFEMGGQFVAINLNTKQFEFLSKDSQLIKGSFVDSITEQIRQITLSFRYTISGWLKQDKNEWYGLVNKIQLKN